MRILVIIGYVLAIVNPVILGVLIGYIVYRNRKTRGHGFNIIVLSLTIAIVYLALLIVLTNMLQWKSLSV